jgi:uncharacterized protein (DUF2252 family)
MRRRCAVILFATALAGCGPTRDDRATWIRDTLLAADAPYLSRDPELVAEKYRRMAADPYQWMRGNGPVFAADLARPGARPATSFVTDADEAAVLIFGDAHPENLGTVLADDPPRDLSDPAPLLGVEIVDLDAAQLGPPITDLRRAVVGLGVLADGLGASDDAIDEAVQAFALGYADTLAPPTAAPLMFDAPITDALRRDALTEGYARERLHAWSADGRLRVVDALVAGDGLLALTPPERDQVDRLLDAYRAYAPSGFRVLDAARRYGAGIGSLPAIRYVVLWDRGEAGDADDDLLQVREIVDPTALRALDRPQAPFASNAERVAFATRTLSATADPRAATLEDGGQSFKVTSASSWFRGLARNDVPLDQLTAFSREFGALIANGHARSVYADGAAAGPDLRAALTGRRDDLAAELVSAVHTDLPATLDDAAAFAGLVEAEGALLGFDTIPRDVW